MDAAATQVAPRRVAAMPDRNAVATMQLLLAVRRSLTAVQRSHAAKLQLVLAVDAMRLPETVARLAAVRLLLLRVAAKPRSAASQAAARSTAGA